MIDDLVIKQWQVKIMITEETIETGKKIFNKIKMSERWRWSDNCMVPHVKAIILYYLQFSHSTDGPIFPSLTEYILLKS